MALQLPSKLHNDSNWLRFAICAACSVQEYPTEFLDNLETEIPHHHSCLFDQTIIKCSTVPFYNMELIHQSVASDKPKNEASCSYEDPNLGRLRRPIYPEQSSRDSIYLEDQHPDNQLSKSDLQVTN